MSAEAAPRTARKRKARVIVACVLVALVVAAIAAAADIFRSSKHQVVASGGIAAERGELKVTVSGDGKAYPEQTYEVYPEVSGIVSDVEVSVGQLVKAGQTLFTLDEQELLKKERLASRGVMQAKRQADSARRKVTQAKNQVRGAKTRLQRLQSQSATPVATFEQLADAEDALDASSDALRDAEDRYADTVSALEAASEEHESAQADLDKVTVVAPADGVITAVNVAEGGSAAPGAGGGGASGAGSGASASSGSSAPVVIASPELKVTVAINQVDIADLKADQSAIVVFDAASDLNIHAKVTRISPSASGDGAVVSYDVELELVEQHSELRAGMTATGDIITSRVADALLVPKSTLSTTGEKKFVMVVNRDGTKTKRFVSTGLSDEVNIQILSGLKSGELVALGPDDSEQSQPEGGFSIGGPPVSSSAPAEGQ